MAAWTVERVMAQTSCISSLLSPLPPPGAEGTAWRAVVPALRTEIAAVMIRSSGRVELRLWSSGHASTCLTVCKREWKNGMRAGSGSLEDLAGKEGIGVTADDRSVVFEPAGPFQGNVDVGCLRTKMPGGDRPQGVT
jgi:hypothetical protein